MKYYFVQKQLSSNAIYQGAYAVSDVLALGEDTRGSALSRTFMKALRD
jgi:hypothetical protein